MPDVDLFERAVRRSIVGDFDAILFDIPDKNRPAWFRGMDDETIRVIIMNWRAELVSRHGNLATSFNNRAKGDFVTQSGNTVEIKLGQRTDANIGLKVFNAAFGTDLNFKQGIIERRKMVPKSDEVRLSKERTVEYFNTTVSKNIGRDMSNFVLDKFLGSDYSYELTPNGIKTYYTAPQGTWFLNRVQGQDALVTPIEGSGIVKIRLHIGRNGWGKGSERLPASSWAGSPSFLGWYLD